MVGLIVGNLARRRGRTVLTAVGIAVGVATIVALLSLADGLKRSASGFAHLGRAEFGLFQRDVSDPTASVLPISLVRRVRAVPGVRAATPIELILDAVHGQPQAIVFGIVPGSFVAQRLVVVAGHRPRSGQVMLGDALASHMHLRPGGSLRLKGRRFKVAGVYHIGVTYQDQGAIVPFADADRLMGRHDEATTIAVALSPRASAATVAARLRGAFPGTTTIGAPGASARADPTFALVDKAVLVIAILALVVGAIGVTNTMVMAVIERQGELGLLAAVGFSRRQIAALIMGEGIGVSVLGAALGLALGVAAAEVLVRALSASAFVTPDLTAGAFGRGILIGVAIGVLGGLYPAWRVSRLQPATSLARG